MKIQKHAWNEGFQMVVNMKFSFVRPISNYLGQVQHMIVL
jgi:hypothetical protein